MPCTLPPAHPRRGLRARAFARITAGGNLILYNDSHMKGYSCWK